MLKQILLIGAAAVSFPALAQETAPAGPAAPTAVDQPAPAPTDPMTPAPTDPMPAPTDPMTGSPAPTGSAPPAGEATAQPAPSGAAATPAQIAQIVNTEFPTYDGDKSNDLNETEFATWMAKLRTATDPTADPASEQVKTWIGQAWAAADGDKSGAVSKEELTGFLSRGA